MGLVIAFNATSAARAAAHQDAGGNDLRFVLPILQKWQSLLILRKWQSTEP
ncbi:MAG: hypothetical protein ABW000_16065 [Actinoplanes sp.]